MSQNTNDKRFAHTIGYTHCCYTADGSRIITSGADGDIRIWKGINDDDPTSKCVGEFVLCIVHYDQRMLVSTDLNTVQAYTFPDGDRDGTEFRFTAPVTCIKVDKKFIAAGSEDMVIKVVPLDKSEEYFELTGHEGPILKIDTSPKELLASSSGDGTIRIWDLKEKKEIKCITGFEKIKSFFAAKAFVSPSFEPVHGKTMAYIKNKEIIILDTDDWKVRTTLKDEKITSDYSICCYSPCGKYLAAGTVSGEITIWNTKFGEKTKGEPKDSDTNGITAIDWNPLNNGELVYTDDAGQLGSVDDCYGESVDDILDSVDDRSETDVNFDNIEFPDNDEDEDNDNCVSLEKLKNETMKKNIQDEIDELLEIKTNRSDKSFADDVVPINAIPLQPPFQPSATPNDLEHRYMVWNNIGIIRAHTTDAENSIEVEFHDASIHHGIHMTNYLHHTMASLSSTVLALSGETPSKLVCIALGAGSREWSISLSNCEEVLALAASEKLVAIVTDARYLRLFTAFGTQREVISLLGPAIAVAGYGDMVLVAYHNGPATSDQNISVMLVHTIGLSIRCQHSNLPLTPTSKLTWIGYSDQGSPVTCDSLGMMRMLNTKSNCWIPICDTTLHTKNISDNFFIIDVSEKNQVVRAILCRGASYPMTTPKPMVSELPMQIPACDLEAEKTLLEESLIRCANFHVDNSEHQMKEISLKLFALACHSEMESRAKELIEMIASPSLLPLAVKYATKIGRIHLAEKLGALLPQFEEQEKEKEKHFNDIEMEAINLLQNSPMSATLLLAPKEKNTTPIITPKPMVISQSKRNPFKRGSLSVTKTVKNPLSHLTDKAIGYNDSQDLQSINGCIPLEDEIKTQESEVRSEQIVNVTNNENKANNQNTPTSSTPQPTFMSWFAEHKDELQAEFPDAIASELTKQGMRKYKLLSASNKDTPKSSGSLKRKATYVDVRYVPGVAKIVRLK